MLARLSFRRTFGHLSHHTFHRGRPTMPLHVSRPVPHLHHPCHVSSLCDTSGQLVTRKRNTYAGYAFHVRLNLVPMLRGRGGDKSRRAPSRSRKGAQ